jgi:hypothetical protein
LANNLHLANNPHSATSLVLALQQRGQQQQQQRAVLAYLWITEQQAGCPQLLQHSPQALQQQQPAAAAMHPQGISFSSSSSSSGSGSAISSREMKPQQQLPLRRLLLLQRLAQGNTIST